MSQGPARASSRANPYGDERPRVSGTLRTERQDINRQDSNRKAQSPQPGSQYQPTQHKRTASGNPRPISGSTTTTDERRYEERRTTEHRVTDRTLEAHLQRLGPRPSSHDRDRQGRQRAPPERKSQEVVPKQKVPQPRSRAETPQAEGTNRGHFNCNLIAVY